MNTARHVTGPPSAAIPSGRRATATGASDLHRTTAAGTRGTTPINSYSPHTRDGAELEESRMPAFGDSLTDDEIISVLEFFKSTWGHEERAFQWHVTWTEQQRTES